MSTHEMQAIGYDNKSPKFNGKNYAWWKNRMQNIIMGIDYKCWMIVKNGLAVVKQLDDLGVVHIKKESD